MVSKKEVRLSFIRCAVLARVQCSNAGLLSIYLVLKCPMVFLTFRSIAESLMVDSDLQPDVWGICTIGMLSSIACNGICTDSNDVFELIPNSLSLMANSRCDPYSSQFFRELQSSSLLRSTIEILFCVERKAFVLEVMALAPRDHYFVHFHICNPKKTRIMP
jgi:hypothetical protein